MSDTHTPPEPLRTTVNGRVWKRFACSYKSPDGRYAFDIYALSREHAEMLIDDLKSTTQVDGELLGYESGRQDKDES